VKCPGCNAVIGRFRAATDTGELTETIRCRRNGREYALHQDIPQHPPAPGSKANKRRKSRRPIVIAQRRDAADSNTKSRKIRKVQRRTEAAA
jgi:hypothetical protein